MDETPVQLPHWIVTTLDGRRVAYREIWQHRNLVLIVLPPEPSEEFLLYSTAIADLVDGLLPRDTACVTTTDSAAGYDPPALVIADRWGEVRAVHHGTLPTVDDVLASVEHVRMACPECEGEWK